MGSGARRRRLPRRYRRPLLLGAVSVCARPGRCARDPRDGRNLPAWPAHRQSCPVRLQGAPHDDSGAYAGGAPRSGRLERGHADGTGRRRGTTLRGAGRTAAGPATPSPASLSQLPGRAVAGAEIWRRTPGGGLRTRLETQCRELQERAGYPQEWPRLVAARRAAHARPARAREPARRRLLSIEPTALTRTKTI